MFSLRHEVLGQNAWPPESRHVESQTIQSSEKLAYQNSYKCSPHLDLKRVDIVCNRTAGCLPFTVLRILAASLAVKINPRVNSLIGLAFCGSNSMRRVKRIRKLGVDLD